MAERLCAQVVSLPLYPELTEAEAEQVVEAVLAGEVPQRDRPPEVAAAPEWEYIPEGWSYPTRGWDAEAVADTYARKWPDYLAAIEAPKPLGVHHETAEVLTGDPDAHNVLVTFAYVLALAARGHDAALGARLGRRARPLPGARPVGAARAGARLARKGAPAVAARGRELYPAVAFHDDESPLERALRPRRRELVDPVRGGLAGAGRAAGGRDGAVPLSWRASRSRSTAAAVRRHPARRTRTATTRSTSAGS